MIAKLELVTCSMPVNLLVKVKKSLLVIQWANQLVRLIIKLS